VISLGGIVYSKSVRVAGDKMDEAIVQYINRKYNFLIGLGTAETIKMSIGNACGGEDLGAIAVKGRDLVSGTPKILNIKAQEVREMIFEEVNAIVQAVRSALEQMPPELSADILDRGIVLSGGGALLKNLDVLLKEEMRVPITVAENPLLTVALGAGKALDNMDALKHVLVD
jgi:rod shape-determining protein MreB and related proteins